MQNQTKESPSNQLYNNTWVSLKLHKMETFPSYRGKVVCGHSHKISPGKFGAPERQSCAGIAGKGIG